MLKIINGIHVYVFKFTFMLINKTINPIIIDDFFWKTLQQDFGLLLVLKKILKTITYQFIQQENFFASN